MDAPGLPRVRHLRAEGRHHPHRQRGAEPRPTVPGAFSADGRFLAVGITGAWPGGGTGAIVHAVAVVDLDPQHSFAVATPDIRSTTPVAMTWSGGGALLVRDTSDRIVAYEPLAGGIANMFAFRPRDAAAAVESRARSPRASRTRCRANDHRRRRCRRRSRLVRPASRCPRPDRRCPWPCGWARLVAPRLVACGSAGATACRRDPHARRGRRARAAARASRRDRRSSAPGSPIDGVARGHGGEAEVRELDVGHLVPRDWARHEGVPIRAHRVRRRDGAVTRVLVVVEEDALAALLLPPLRRRDLGDARARPRVPAPTQRGARRRNPTSRTMRTLTWMPRDPDVFGNPSMPCSASTSRTCMRDRAHRVERRRPAAGRGRRGARRDGARPTGAPATG